MTLPHRILAIAGIVVTSPLWLYWLIRAWVAKEDDRDR